MALIGAVRTETDSKRKRKLIDKIGEYNRQIDTMKSGKLLSRETKRDLVAYSFIAPNFIGFCVFTLIPIIFAFALAFMKWAGSNPIQWAGIGNFTRLTDDIFFRAALKNTVIYCIGTVPLTMIASLALAIILNSESNRKGHFQDPVLFPVCGFPCGDYGSLVIYLAGLQGISSELYEAASLDGANTWQKFRYIIWPQLSSTTFFVVVMLTINCFKVYDIAIMLAGGSGELTTSATVLVYYIYQKAFIDWDLGYSSAVAMVLFIMVLVVTIIQFRGQAKRERA